MSGRTKEKSCGAIVCRIENGDIYTLVIRQNQGHWCFPKGHVENQETERETASREVEEETGVKIRFLNGFRQETHYSPSPGVEKEVVYFVAAPDGGKEKIQKSEVSEMKWVRLSEALALLTYDNDTNLLRSAVRYLKMQDSDDLLGEKN